MNTSRGIDTKADTSCRITSLRHRVLKHPSKLADLIQPLWGCISWVLANMWEVAWSWFIQNSWLEPKKNLLMFLQKTFMCTYIYLHLVCIIFAPLFLIIALDIIGRFRFFYLFWNHNKRPVYIYICIWWI